MSATTVRRVTVEEYTQMVRDGVLTETDRAELLNGVVTYKMSQNEPHVSSIGRLIRLFSRLVPDEYDIRCQGPIVLEDSVPEPDFAVAHDDAARGGRPPRAENVYLVVEVSDTTLRIDRGLKLRMYAEAGIPVYWIVNIPDRVVEVYTDPDAGAVPAIYRRVTTYTPADAVPVEVAGVVVGTVPAAAILP